MSVTLINGGQWGDEGKGKIVDFLAERHDAGVRSTAGDNAGHTVQIGNRTLAFRVAPSSIASGMLSFITDDVMINPVTLNEEIDMLTTAGVPVAERLKVSRNAHLILPYHVFLDRAVEEGGGAKIGTTRKGVGPAMADKVNRVGIRMEDFIDPDRFAERLARNAREKLAVARALYPKAVGADTPEEFDVNKLLAQFQPLAERIAPLVTDTVSALHALRRDGKHILLEGAQGSMNDLSYGTYPFVTSSRPVAAGVTTGAGLGPRHVDRVISVIKPYQTRVGIGPVMAEVEGPAAEAIRQRGREFGTVTGRSRRIMWFDAVVANYTRDLNGTDYFALTKLDVLDDLDEIKICTGYERNGNPVTEYPSQNTIEEHTEQWETLPGWHEDTSTLTSYRDLPANAKKLVERIAELTETPIGILSLGPERSQTIVLDSGCLPK